MADQDTKSTFNEAALPSGLTKANVIAFFKAAISNDAAAVLPFAMNYPKECNSWQTTENMNALMYAAREGNKEVAWLLIKSGGANFEMGNENGSTPLMFAAHAGKATVVAMLLEAGADVNHINKNGHTPLMSAAANGYKHTAEQLLKFNADVTVKDQDGNSASDYARENGFTEIQKMIEDASVTQAAARAKAAAEAKAAAAQVPGRVIDDNEAHLKDLEQKLQKAKLT